MNDSRSLYRLLYVVTALVLAGTISNAAYGQAVMVKSNDPQSVIAALKDLGFRGGLEKDSLGDPLITYFDEGHKMVIAFYDCEKNSACESIQFTAGYDMPDGMKDTAPIQKWNAEKRFSSAYIDDENDPRLKMDILLEESGIAMDIFASYAGIWKAQKIEFESAIGW
jgi:hypothetical protein